MPTTTIYTLKISLSDRRGRPGDIWRTVEIADFATLKRLHKLIFEAFDREDDHLWSFFFGKPEKKGTEEYTTSASKDDLFPTRARYGSSVRLSSLPFRTVKEIHYLFDFGDEWWHRVEFLGESPVEDGVKYPRIIEKRGDSPEQYPEEEDEDDDEAVVTPEEGAEVSYATLGSALKSHPGALSASETFGVIFGVLAAPGLPQPSVYLPSIFGDEPPASVKQTGKILNAVLPLHNQILNCVNNGQPCVLRPTYPETYRGVINQVADLHDEIYGFVKGLVLGGAQRPKPGTKLDKLMEQMIGVDDTLQEILALANKRLRQKTPSDVESLVISAQSLAEQLSQHFLNTYMMMQHERVNPMPKAAQPIQTPSPREPCRNDPCPCGSGKKFKYCHGAGGKFTIH